jgi:transposase
MENALTAYLKQLYPLRTSMDEQQTLFDLSSYDKSYEKTESSKGKARINSPVRNVTELKMFCLEDVIPADHKARFVWSYVQKLDMSGFITKIQSVEGHVGRPATDPHLLLSLWIYATIEGIGSGRVIETYCRDHSAFKWLCGNVSVNYHTITDFRTNNKELLDDLLTQSVAVFLKQGMITLDRIAQDGIRVRASAGSSSFRRQETLEDHYQLAKLYVEQLISENNASPNEILDKKKAAELRFAKEKEIKLKQALEQLELLKKSKAEAKKKQRKQFTEKEEKNVRASSVDPESRKMKMANGGFSPAYNAQIATDTKTQVIVGMSVTNAGFDIGQMTKMHEQIQERFKKNCIPVTEWLVDGGYNDKQEIEKMKVLNCEVYMPPKNSQLPESYNPKEGDSEVIKEWRINMGTIEAKTIYKDRAATAECVNAAARNRGLQQFSVRGIDKVTAVMFIFGITHNLLRALSLLD